MFQKKRYMTMIETLIALGITMMILSTLTFFYRQITTINSEVEKLQDESFRKRYVENRLAAILPKAISEKDKKKDFFFFSTSSILSFTKPGSPTLVFTYDNGVKLDKPFSNHVLGRLYLSDQGFLTLATWPSPNRWDWNGGGSPPMKRELLLEGVKELKFEFFVAPDRDWEFNKTQAAQPSPSVEKPTPEGHWIDQWSPNFQQLPAMVRIRVGLEKSEYTFVFPLPKSQRQIVYKQ